MYLNGSEEQHVTKFDARLPYRLCVSLVHFIVANDNLSLLAGFTPANAFKTYFLPKCINISYDSDENKFEVLVLREHVLLAVDTYGLSRGRSGLMVHDG